MGREAFPLAEMELSETVVKLGELQVCGSSIPQVHSNLELP